MNILVTGAGGFIGSNLCRRLVRDGHQVWAVDNFVTGVEENLASLKGNPNFTFHTCGMETPEFLTFAKEIGVKFDRVYDLACPTGVPNIEILGEEMLLACSEGMRNVLRVAKEHGAKFLLTSSSEMYGAPLVAPQTEKYTGNVDPVGPRANYEEGKRFAETWTALYVKKYGLDARIVRLFNAYGPQMSIADYRVIPQFMMQALKGAPLTVHGEGTQTRTLCYIDDTIEGILLAMEEGAMGEVYNIGGDDQISMRALADAVIEATNSTSEISFVPRASHDHESRLPGLEKIHALGWKQTVTLAEGLPKTVEFFRSKVSIPSPVELSDQSATPTS